MTEGEELILDIDNGCLECMGDLWAFLDRHAWQCEECFDELDSEPFGPHRRPEGMLMVSRGFDLDCIMGYEPPQDEMP